MTNACNCTQKRAIKIGQKSNRVILFSTFIFCFAHRFACVNWRTFHENGWKISSWNKKKQKSGGFFESLCLNFIVTARTNAKPLCRPNRMIPMNRLTFVRNSLFGLNFHFEATAIVNFDKMNTLQTVSNNSQLNIYDKHRKKWIPTICHGPTEQNELKTITKKKN